MFRGGGTKNLMFFPARKAVDVHWEVVTDEWGYAGLLVSVFEFVSAGLIVSIRKLSPTSSGNLVFTHGGQTTHIKNDDHESTDRGSPMYTSQ